MTTSFGDDDPLDPFADVGDLPPLELAEPAPAPVPRSPAQGTAATGSPAAPGAAAPPPEPSTHQVHAESTPPAGASARPSANRPPSPAELRERARHKAEVAALAGFGEPPQSPLGALPYTLQVLFRGRDLWRRRAELRARLAPTRRRVEAAHAALGAALLRHQRTDLDAHGLSELAAGAERAMGATDSQRQLVERTRAEAEAERRRLDEEIARAEAAVAPLRDREAKLRAELEVLSHELRRRKAALDRVRIELRNAPDQAAALEASLQARQNDVAVQQTKVDAKTEELQEVQRRLAAGLEQIQRHQATRRHLDRELTGGVRSVEASAEQASTATERALAELARAARKAGLPMSVLEAATAIKADEHLAQLQRELALHEEALRSWDQRSVAIGASLLALFAIVMLVVFVQLLT